MTWARYLATGSGKTRFRLAIEGLAYEFVTDADMERAIDTNGLAAGRLVGLLRESLVGGEEVHPGTAELEQDVMNVRIVESLDLAVGQVLAYRPSITTWLTAELSTSATSVEVESTTGFAANDIIHIGTEAMWCTAVTDADTLAVSRAKLGSIAQRHVIGDGETRANPAVTNRPLFLEGRRARLYAYGEGDSVSGDGTQIWLGVCQTDARLDGDGGTWEIQIAGIWQITEQDLGADLATPKKPRGIYYPWSAPLVIYLAEGSSSAVGSATSATATLLITGFWETQEEFCAYVTAEIAALTPFPAGGGVLTAVPNGADAHWSFLYRTGGTARWPLIRTFSKVDHQIDSKHEPISSTKPEGIGAVAINTDYPLNPPFSKIADELLGNGAGTVPRGSLGANSAEGRIVDSSVQLDWPSGVIPLDGDLSALEATGTVQMQAVSHLGVTIDGVVPYLEVMGTPTGSPPEIEAVANWLQLDPSNASTNENALGEVGFDLTWTSTRLPEMRFMRTYLESGNVGGFQVALVLDAAENANTGTWPFVTSSDLGEWATEAAAAARSRPAVSKRVYAGSEATSLRELLIHEFRLLGVYPVVESNGKIDIQALRVAASTEVTQGDVDASAILVDGQKPTWERNALGSINTVRYPTGWNPRTNEHEGRVVVVRDVGAYTLRKATRELEVAPRSAYVGGDASVATADYVDLAQPVLGLFGRDYVVIDVECAMTAYEFQLGNLVSLSYGDLPDWRTGERGISSEAAVVIGRRWDLNRGRVNLRLLLSAQDVAGYTPTLTITTKNSGTDGTVGPFNFNWSSEDPLGTGDYYASNETNILRHWPTSAPVQIVQWDATSPTTRQGTLSAITQSTSTTGTVTITFTSAFPGLSTDLWTLRYPISSTTGLTAAQWRYCFVGDSDARIPFDTLDDLSARTFAP